MPQNDQALLMRLLNIDALIASKSALGREKDLEAVRLLRVIKEKQQKPNI